MTEEHLKPWRPLSPEEVGKLFTGAPFRWWLAGGYAIERFVGRPLREHSDIDVLILRRDHIAARDYLAAYDCWVADPPGKLRPWPRGVLLSDAAHDVWCRVNGLDVWQFQLMVDESADDNWVSRRDARIRLPANEIGFVSDGMSVLAPEIQLFYKAKAPRAKDESDFASAAPSLSDAQRERLAQLIQIAYGASHPWLARL
ncbi:MAG: amino acid transporter [Alphaproteobacteria bacterium]